MRIIDEHNEDRTLAWVSYLTLIGWVVSIVLFINNDRNNLLVRFHLRQSLGINLTGMAISFISPVILWLPFSKMILGLAGIALVVLWLLGFLSALSGEKKTVPFLGEWYDKILSFIE